MLLPDLHVAQVHGVRLLADSPVAGLPDAEINAPLGDVRLVDSMPDDEGSAGGERLIAPPGVACLARLTPEPTVHLQCSGSETERSNWLCSSFLPALLAGQGALVLRGAAVLGPAGAVLILGPAMAGKSTATALLVESGWKLLGDDVVVLLQHQNAIHVCAGPPWLKLWPGVADHLALGSQAVELRSGLAKRLIQLTSLETVPTHHPVAGVFVLRVDDRSGYRSEPLSAGGLLEVAGTLQRRPALAPTATALRQQFSTLCALARLDQRGWLSRPSANFDATQLSSLRDSVGI